MADIYLTDGDDVYEQNFDERDIWNHYRGQGGNDLIRIYNGIAVGGAGNDRFELIPVASEPWREIQLAYWDDNGATVDLEQGWAQDGFGGRDTFTGARKIHGSGGNDWFKGDASDNYFWPNGGQDTLIGGAGNDGITIHWFDPGNGEPGRPARLTDVKVDVSVDGRQATIAPLTGSGFSYTLTDIEFFDLEELTGWKQYRLADFITQQTMARDAVAAGGELRWNAAGALGMAATLTYSFVTTAPASGVGAPGFRSFSASERQLVRDILARTASASGLVFTEVTESASVQGQLRFGVSQQAATKGVSWLPGQPGAGGLAGDVWMDVESMAGITPGSEGYQALLHEIGHALGLRHPRNVDGGDAWALQMRELDDRTALTVMSQQASADGLFRSEWGPLDVLALRHLYGSRAVATGPQTYALGALNAGSQTTLTDDGGIDTLDASALAIGASLSLVPGTFSSAGLTPRGLAAVDNVALTEGTWIEHAVGTAFDDVLTGNALDNRLTGGRGNDWIDGGAGSDTAVFSGNLADYDISNAFGVNYVEALDGVSGYDTLLNVEVLAFADRTVPVDRVVVVEPIQQSETLTARVNVAQTDGLSTFSYQWRANGADIAGATTATYVPGQAQVNQQLSVIVSYTDSRGNSENLLAALGSVANVNDAPTGSVTISGHAAVGQVLTASHTLEDLDGLGDVTFQWRRNGVDLQGANGVSYTVKSGDIGRRITVVAHYWDGHGSFDGLDTSDQPRLAGVSRSGTADADTLTGDNGENLLTGLAGADVLWGLGGGDLLDGGAGADTMRGGDGDDTYVMDDVRDQAVESNADATTGGRDTVVSSLTWALGNHLENLTLTGNGALNGTGNGLDNLIVGHDGSNTLSGAAGHDTLEGGAGADLLNGGTGDDVMRGGTGNDVYVVDSVGDQVEESSTLASEVDRVSTSVSWTLGANVENLTLAATAGDIQGTGNALRNLIQGNAGHNRLGGLEGNDTLTGGAGNDTLDGGAGADQMQGQEGNDTYHVDSPSDLTTESSAAHGTDHVIASVNRTLGSHFENLTLAGAAVLGSGNALHNVITGNDGANSLNGVAGDDTLHGDAGNDTLIGGTGNDSMLGGAGNDVYAVDASGDVVVELADEGTDRVSSTVHWVLGANLENLTLAGTAAINGTGNALGNVITGNAAANAVDAAAGDDTLSGGDGNDTLTGGTGRDHLTGGTGADRFRFVTTGDGVDTISDFASGSDKIHIVAANFGLVAGGTANLVVNANPGSGAAVFVYTSATGSLAFDADGNGPGVAVSLAVLQSRPGALLPADIALGP